MERRGDEHLGLMPEEVADAIMSLYTPEELLSCGKISNKVTPLIRQMNQNYQSFGTYGAPLDEVRSELYQTIRQAVRELQPDDVVGELSGMFADILAQVDPGSLETKEFEFCNLEVQGNDFACAGTNLFYTPWSPTFVHGSDSLIFVNKIAEEILENGETITEMLEVSWLKPMTSNLIVSAYARDFDQIDNKGDYSLTAKFRTSNGRVISVFGIQDDSRPIEIRMSRNPYAEMTTCGCDNCMSVEGKGKFSFPLHDPRVNGCYSAFEKDRSLAVATMAETLTIALSHALTRVDIETEREGGVLKLMGGVRNMKIPADLRDVYSVNGTLDVEVLEDKVRPGSSGMTLIPFRYRFPGQQNFSMGIGALTSSENVAESCLGEGC